MRVPIFKMFMTSPFEGLQEHAEKVKECAWAFQQAMECHFSPKCTTFEEFRQEIIKIESQADAIKRRIRGHIPKETMMPISNFLLFRYLREQDGVLDAVEDTLDWISYRSTKKIPPELKKDFALLVDSVIDSIEMLSTMVAPKINESKSKISFANCARKNTRPMNLKILLNKRFLTWRPMPLPYFIW
jgi:predicted phosphate transport protein (TIGR00153 family)